ncbi:MAG: hypothetical protein GF411_15490 [Candidatus Lokiarchaeota archaeon]|nr:hypothetical protein [Candidatus Lokiarchaeota archaeon]
MIKMTKAIVLYNSRFGNTKNIAQCLAKGIESQGITTTCENIDVVDVESLRDYDFIAIGGPTHILKMSDELNEFMQKLRDVILEKIAGFAFDTRNESKMNKTYLMVLENSAARRIEKQMKKLGVEIVHPRRSALVEGEQGPLYKDEEQRFFQIGLDIGKILKSASFISV